MKILLVNASPKRKKTASAYFLHLLKLMLNKKTKTVLLRNKNDFNNVIDNMKDSLIVIFSFPLYVDSLPSHLLAFLKEFEEKAKMEKIKIYLICNSGFIEGRQSETVFKVFKNFSQKSNVEFKGGISIGGGIMLNILKTVIAVWIICYLLLFLSNVFFNDQQFLIDNIISFATFILIILFLNLHVFYSILKLNFSIKNDKYIKKYSRVLLPSFLYIIITNIFFTIISFFKGGIFKGWLSKK